MAYSPLPLINYILWVSTRRFLSPFAEDCELSVKNLYNGSPSLNDNTLQKNPSVEKSQTSRWFAVLSLSMLVVIMYASVLISLARQWLDDPNYGHGFLVPLFVGYVLWSKRDQWRTLPFRPNNFGFAIMLFAVGLRILGMMGAELFLARVSLVILISGMVLFLAGSQTLRWMAFPLGYLLFMIPLPAIVYYQLTFPLQLLASRLGASGLIALGIHTVRQGNLLMLPNCTLNVVEACSGIRSLLSLLAAVVAFAYMAEPSWWKRGMLAVASIPIAIATNGLRLVATGVLSYFFRPAVDSGVVHLILGLGFFVLAFLLIVLIHKLLQLLPRYGSQVPVVP
jgi:exosortase